VTGSVDILLDRIFWLVEEALMGRLRISDREGDAHVLARAHGRLPSMPLRAIAARSHRSHAGWCSEMKIRSEIAYVMLTAEVFEE